MNPSLVKEPSGCSAAERGAFARMVLEGFAADASTLQDRIDRARWLGFHYAADAALAGVAAIKGPPASYRNDLFSQAAAPVTATEYDVELGWIFVATAYRRQGVATTLCRDLLERVSGDGVFATTRIDNRGMPTILERLGFRRVGVPYARRDEMFTLYLRAPGGVAT